MAIEVVTKFDAGESVWILAYFTDQRTGVAPAADPDSITVSLSDTDGEAIFTDEAMSRYGDAGSGEWEYFYPLEADATVGWWTGTVTVVDGIGDAAKTTIGKFGFNVQ